MGFLKRLFTGKSRDEDDSRPLLDFLGNDQEALELGRVEYFDVFLENVREVAPPGSILVLEGNPASDVQEFLERVRIEPEVRIARGTTWPKQEFFHVPATRENLDEILDFLLNHSQPEVCDHLVLYLDQQVLLWLHDVIDGYVFGHPSLGEAELERVKTRLRPKRR